MKYEFYLYTKYTISVQVEADSKEEAENKIWEMYNNEEIDPLMASDIETNTEYNGIIEEAV